MVEAHSLVKHSIAINLCFSTVTQENMQLKEQIEVLLRENTILKRAVAIQHERQKEFEDKNLELQHLKQLVSQYQEQLRTLEVRINCTTFSILFPSIFADLFKVFKHVHVHVHVHATFSNRLETNYVAFVVTGKQLCIDNAFEAGSTKQLDSRTLPSRCLLAKSSVKIKIVGCRKVVAESVNER